MEKSENALKNIKTGYNKGVIIVRARARDKNDTLKEYVESRGYVGIAVGKTKTDPYGRNTGKAISAKYLRLARRNNFSGV